MLYRFHQNSVTEREMFPYFPITSCGISGTLTEQQSPQAMGHKWFWLSLSVLKTKNKKPNMARLLI